MRRPVLCLLASAFALSTCGDTSAPEPAAKQTEASPTEPAVHAHADWAGKWVGPKGLFVDVTPTAPGQYKLEMMYDLDTTGTYEGTDSPGGIAFALKGEAKLLRAAKGEEIGLKWLDGKQDCLMVEDGVGFCRD